MFLLKKKASKNTCQNTPYYTAVTHSHPTAENEYNHVTVFWCTKQCQKEFVYKWHNFSSYTQQGKTAEVTIISIQFQYGSGCRISWHDFDTINSFRPEPIQPLRCKQRVETTAYSHLMKKFIAFRGVIKSVFISEPQYKIAGTSETFILCVRYVPTVRYFSASVSFLIK